MQNKGGIGRVANIVNQSGWNNDKLIIPDFKMLTINTKRQLAVENTDNFDAAVPVKRNVTIDISLRFPKANPDIRIDNNVFVSKIHNRTPTLQFLLFKNPLSTC